MSEVIKCTHQWLQSAWLSKNALNLLVLKFLPADDTCNNTVYLLFLFSHIPTLKLDQKTTITAAADTLSTSTPWCHGYSEMSGQRNK